MNKTLTAILTIVIGLGILFAGCGGETPQGPQVGEPVPDSQFHGPAESEQNGSALGRITGVSMDSTQSPQAGELAPDFYFETPEGEPSSLTTLKGSPVLLNFWATWCGPCRREMPYLQQIWDEWQEKGLVLLAINSSESSSDVESFMQSQGFSFPVLLDSQWEAGNQYGIRAIPTTFFIDREGIIQEVHVGTFQSKAEIENILNQLD
jgi:cytochrome c biogenesis protein CcmG/thiol:disulfide interchange protein DsbE